MNNIIDFKKPKVNEVISVAGDDNLNTVIANLSVELGSQSFTNTELIAEACWWLSGVSQYVIRGYMIKEGQTFDDVGKEIRDALIAELDNHSPAGYSFYEFYGSYGYFKEL